MWWPKPSFPAGSIALGAGAKNALAKTSSGTRTKSAPQKAKTSKRAWSPSSWLSPKSASTARRGKGLSKTWGTWTATSLPALGTALPSPFPSPAHKEGMSFVPRATSAPHKARDQERHGKGRHHTFPSTNHTFAWGDSESTQSDELNSAAFLARGRDWISSKSDRLFQRNRVSTLKPQKSLSRERKERLAEISELRNELNLPKDVMLQAYDIFYRHADQTIKKLVDTKLVEERRLTEAGFAKVWHEMSGQDYDEEDKRHVPPQIIIEAFRHADQSRELEFSQFAIWYSSCCFCEDVSLDKEGKKLRKIARKHSMHHSEVERYKQIFNRFDTDGNGTIDSSEFEELLCTCIKAPASIGLPPARVKHLWQNADENGDHEIDFEEFLEFYTKYLGVDSHGFEDYYKIGGAILLNA